jgi:hypothetical protein
MECLINICQLTQLTQLQLYGNAGLGEQQVMLLTGLTRLQQLGIAVAKYFGEPVAACAKLARLTQLQHLSLAPESSLAPGDALALTALTELTSLVLAGVGSGVGDDAAAAIAGSCRQLRHLNLYGCDLISLDCLTNICQLAQLTQLQLGGNAGLTKQQKMLLTGLRRLQQLGFDTS